MNNFKVGDRVEIVCTMDAEERLSRVGIKGRIEDLNYQAGDCPIMLDNGHCVSPHQIRIIPPLRIGNIVKIHRDWAYVLKIT